MRTDYVILPASSALLLFVAGVLGLVAFVIFKLSPESITLICGLGMGLFVSVSIILLVLASAGRRSRERREAEPSTPAPIVILLQPAGQSYKLISSNDKALVPVNGGVMSIYDEDWGDVVDTPRTVGIDKQRELGLARATKYTPAVPTNAEVLTHAEQGLLSQAVQAAGHLIANRQMSHIARSDDTAVTHAVGSLVYSIPYLLVAAAITGAAMFLAFFVFEGDELVYFMLWLIIWGVSALHYLTKNRELGLRHSAAGIELEDIASREELAKFVITAHIDLIKSRWEKSQK